MEIFGTEHPCITHLESVTYYMEKTRGRMVYEGRLRYHELIYVISGEHFVHFAGKTIHETPGTIRFIPKNNTNDEYTVDCIQPGCCIFFCFLAEGMPDEAVQMTPTYPGILENLFQQLNTAWLFQEPGYYAHCMELIYKIIMAIQQQSGRYLPTKLSHILQRTLPYLEAHCFDPDFSYNEMARLSGVSYSYFKRIYIQKYGIPPSAYILSLRIQRARGLLLSTPFSIAHIAEMVGYTDPAYFSRQFKNQTGCSPLQYRKGLYTERTQDKKGTP